MSGEEQYRAAREALEAAFVLYQEWQSNEGDWWTFLDWASDEGPPRPLPESA